MEIFTQNTIDNHYYEPYEKQGFFFIFFRKKTVCDHKHLWYLIPQYQYVVVWVFYPKVVILEHFTKFQYKKH